MTETPVQAEIEYSNGTFKYLQFASKKDARNFIESDGDHVVDYSIWEIDN